MTEMKKLNKHALVACSYVSECLWIDFHTAHSEPGWIPLVLGLQTYYPNEYRTKQVSYWEDYVEPYLRELEGESKC